MKRTRNKAKIENLLNGLTFHAPNSGAFAQEHGLVDDVSGFHHATLKGGTDGHVWLRPLNGSSDVMRVGRIVSGRFLAVPALEHWSRQRVARAALAVAGLDWYLNGSENTLELTMLGFVQCPLCKQWLSRGSSIVDGMGPVCAAKGKTTEREARRAAGMAAMQAILDSGNPYQAYRGG